WINNPAKSYELILEEILEERVVSSRGRRNQRAVKRKMKGWPIKSEYPKGSKINFIEAIKVLSEQY
ncbi:MAG: hypothetical protein PHH77_08960, partial [Victivallaceae bacterium]|nr:hypothetical protein [Victivallaceae bacterium]